MFDVRGLPTDSVKITLAKGTEEAAKWTPLEESKVMNACRPAGLGTIHPWLGSGHTPHCRVSHGWISRQRPSVAEKQQPVPLHLLPIASPHDLLPRFDQRSRHLVAHPVLLLACMCVKHHDR